MSGRIFKPGHLKGEVGKGRYKPVSRGYTYKNVERLIDIFLDGRLSAGGGLYSDIVTSPEWNRVLKHLPAPLKEGYIRVQAYQKELESKTDIIQKHLPSGEDLDANAFLEDVILLLSQQSYEPQYYHILGGNNPEIYVDDLINPLVQALYDRGHNELVVDLTPLDYIVNALASGLKGTKENPLKLTCKGGVWFFGLYVSDCELEMDGDMPPPGPRGEIATGALSSTVVLQGEICQEGPLGGERLGPGIGRGAYNCSVFVKQPLPESYLENLKKGSFFTWPYRNHLFLAAGGEGREGVSR